MTRKLNDKQRRFVEEYLIDLNATQAAIRAGYSEDSARAQGCRLLTDEDISAAVAEAMAERSQRTEITQDMVLAELGRLAFSNIAHYVRWNDSAVELHDSSMIREDALRCVSEVSQTVTKEGGTVKFKLHDKHAALVSLARHLGMFSNDKPSDAGHENTIDGLK